MSNFILIMRGSVTQLVMLWVMVVTNAPLATTFVLNSRIDVIGGCFPTFETLSCLYSDMTIALGGETPRIDPSAVTADDLRSIRVTNANGELVPLGDAMGRSTSIVVFLRHLGCSWCWSYVEYWREVQKDMVDDDITGPIFVSIGDEFRLNAFLDKHPSLPRENMFVDGYNFTAFKEAGFGRFDEKPKEVTENVLAKPIRFGGARGWWIFLSNFVPLAPVTEDMKFPEMFTPEGLFWVGGTFVVNGDEIVYRWDDRISGDHPEATYVLEIARNATRAPIINETKPGFKNFFGLFEP